MEGKSVIRTNEHQRGEGEGQRCWWKVSEKAMKSCSLLAIHMSLQAKPETQSWAMIGEHIVFHSSQRPLRKRPESVTLGLEETNFIALFSSASSPMSSSVSQHLTGRKGNGNGGLVMPNKIVQLLDTCSYYLRTPSATELENGNFC